MTEQDNLANRLWSKGVSESDYGDNLQYRDHLLEQYKLYVEMADRISARRSLANTFFLTLNTGAVAAIAVFLKDATLWTVLPVCIAAIVLCLVWQRLIKSYRQLNTAKYKVIGEMEKRLPSSPYWSAEWKALGEGRDTSKYTQLTVVERFVPIVFVLLYIVLTIGFVTKRFSPPKRPPDVPSASQPAF